MTTTPTVLIAGLMFLALCISASAGVLRQGDSWNYYHFDGRSFESGRAADGKPFLALRTHMVPVAATQPARIDAKRLPAGSGAVAGICYIQVSGGKLKTVHKYLPGSGMSVPITSGGQTITTAHTDDNGYFVAVLPPGRYQVGTPPTATEVTVEKGITTLVPLWTGKRMAD